MTYDFDSLEKLIESKLFEHYKDSNPYMRLQSLEYSVNRDLALIADYLVKVVLSDDKP